MVTRQRKGGEKPAKSGSGKSAAAVATTKKPKDMETILNEASHQPQAPFPLVGLFVFFLCLAAGLLTPPLMSEPRVATEQSVPVPTLNRQTEQQPESGAVESVGFRLCSEERLQNFWHDEYVPGLHIVCFDAPDDSLHLRFYSGGTRQVKSKHVGLPLAWAGLQRLMESEMNLPRPETWSQPWAVFSDQGERLLEANQWEEKRGTFTGLLTTRFGMVLVYEGGQFMWPGVNVGFKRTANLYSLMPVRSPDMGNKQQIVTLETLSLVPLVLSVEGFLSDDECDHIKRRAEPLMEYSQVTLMDKDAGRPASDFRTSQTCFLRDRDAILTDIDYRTASLIRIPRDHQEDVQVLRYGLEEKYDSHHDFFDASLYQNDASTLALIKNGKRNRFATVFWYLSEVEAGGQTVFPRMDRRREISMRDCSGGLKVQPQKGKVIIFYNMLGDGTTDTYSLHGACPVESGVKWAGNKWIWNEPMSFVPA
jgi:prolyl 4-hydroxylase